MALLHGRSGHTQKTICIPGKGKVNLWLRGVGEAEPNPGLSCCPANLSQLCISHMGYEHFSSVPSLSSSSMFLRETSKILGLLFKVLPPQSFFPIESLAIIAYEVSN